MFGKQAGDCHAWGHKTIQLILHDVQLKDCGVTCHCLVMTASIMHFDDPKLHAVLHAMRSAMRKY